LIFASKLALSIEGSLLTSHAAHHTLAPSSTCSVMMIWLLEIDSAMTKRMFGLVKSSVVT